MPRFQRRRRGRMNFKRRVQRAIWSAKRLEVVSNVAVANMARGSAVTTALVSEIILGRNVGTSLNIIRGTGDSERLNDYVHVKGFGVKGFIKKPTGGTGLGANVQPQNEVLVFALIMVPFQDPGSGTTVPLNYSDIFIPNANQFPSQYNMNHDLAPTAVNKFTLLQMKKISLTNLDGTAPAVGPSNISSNGKKLNLWFPLNKLQFYDDTNPTTGNIVMNRCYLWVWCENGRANAAADRWNLNYQKTVYFRDATP